MNNRRLIQTCFVKSLCVTAVGILLCATGVSQVNKMKSIPTSEPCTTRTGLYCEIYGKGDPILAIHGLGASIYTWRYMVGDPRLANNKLILIDLKGAGKSPKPHDKKYSILDQADLIYEFIQEHDLKNLTIMGNSYGGGVSLLLAIRLCKEKPNRLSKLILIDAGAYDIDLPSHLKILRTPVIGWLAVHLLPPKCQARKVLKDSYYDDQKITKEQVAAYAQPIASPGGRYALLETGRQAIPKNFKEIIAQYPTISVPTLVLWGIDDEMIPLKLGRMLHEAIPGSRLELINDCGHIPQEEKPDETICHVAEFLGLPFQSCPK
jgi:pimeloyl-ACP methyl ester carboxylesterase